MIHLLLRCLLIVDVMNDDTQVCEEKNMSYPAGLKGNQIKSNENKPAGMILTF